MSDKIKIGELANYARDLRVFRSYHWESENPDGDGGIAGLLNPMKLVSRDQLQVLQSRWPLDGIEWAPVRVVEGEKPRHPEQMADELQIIVQANESKRNEPKPAPVAGGVTADSDDPGLKKIDAFGMQEKYLVLAVDERAKGYVRPVRRSYTHVGAPGPQYPLRDITTEEMDKWNGKGTADPYVKYETFPDTKHGAGRLWTQAQLDHVGKGCQSETRMSQVIAETYARNPTFYGATYCMVCREHLQVGERGEFVWTGTTERVGT